MTKSGTMTNKRANDSLKESANYIAFLKAKQITKEIQKQNTKTRIVTLPKRPTIPRNRSERRAMHEKPKGAW
jgi:dihydroorotate dehydrogenase